MYANIMKTPIQGKGSKPLQTKNIIAILCEHETI
jgi:hypothetical protein